MSDTRPRVPLTKRIDLEQLTTEVGAALTASDTDVVVADPDSLVTAAQLQAALDAHTPPTPVDHDRAFRAAVEGATTLAALKAAILGSVGPGAQPRNR